MNAGKSGPAMAVNSLGVPGRRLNPSLVLLGCPASGRCVMVRSLAQRGGFRYVWAVGLHVQGDRLVGSILFSLIATGRRIRLPRHSVDYT